MKIRKNYFWGLIGFVTIVVLLIICFLFATNRSSSSTNSQAPQVSEAKPSKAPDSSESTTTPSDTSELDTSLHTQTMTLLQSPAYNTIIDKSADFSAVDIYLDGNLLSISDKPFKYKGRLYLPLRQVGESLGIQIDFNDAYKVAIAQSTEQRLEMPLKYTKAVQIPLAYSDLASTVAIDNFNPEVSVVFYKEKTYLPVRFTAEALGFTVKFDEKDNAVYFTSPT
ncbi:MAG: copper amine oxidase N-terminal domain-containing protein [Cellulosilyticaceae bacterium]